MHPRMSVWRRAKASLENGAAACLDVTPHSCSLKLPIAAAMAAIGAQGVSNSQTLDQSQALCMQTSCNKNLTSIFVTHKINSKAVIPSADQMFVSCI